MKNKLNFRRVLDWIRDAAKQLWKVLSRRTGMKLLSLLLAILLWNYVITSNSSFTRTKTISGISGYVTSQSVLSTYGLALLEDPSDLLKNVTVRLEVAQSEYSLVSAKNVQVTLDLSSVRSSGSQEIPIKAYTSYGKVLSVMPEMLTLSFETLDSRSIPVNVIKSGQERDDLWYSVSRTNPSTITVSGAASVVRSIAQACVYSDITGMKESYSRAEPYVLLDGEGKEISQSMLVRSSSSITVSMDVYPTKEIPISTEISNIVTGQVADGYAVTQVSVQPESITVAAEQELLDGINELLIEPVSVDGVSQSFSARAKISLLTDFKYASAEQVYVNVTIDEDSVSEWIGNTSLSFIGISDNLQAEWQKNDLKVYVTGPKSAVEALKKDGIPVTVDLTGLQAGSYDLELNFPTENYPDIQFAAETPTIEVKLTEKPAE